MAQWVAALEAVIPVVRPCSAEEAAGRASSGAGRAMEASAPPLAPEFLQQLREVHGAVQVRDEPRGSREVAERWPRGGPRDGREVAKR